MWGTATPDNVVDSTGTVIVSASTNPTPGCGCKDLVLTGTVQEEEGKVFRCTTEPTIDDDGNTVITQDNDCALLCDGTLVFDLYCSVGQWSVDYLTTAADIYCYGGGSTNGGLVTLSTFWPPAPTTTTVAADTTPGETTPTETTSGETTPGETTPAETTPADTTPAETTPAETTPADTTPAETTPVETTPAA